MTNYINTQHKIRTLWENVQNNIVLIDKLSNNDIIFNSEHFTKKIIAIPLLENIVRDSPGTRFRGVYRLVNFPEWAIAMIKPIVFYSVPGDGFNAEEVDFTGGAEINVYYWFNKLGENLYSLQYEIVMDASFETDLFANFYLYIINNQNYQVIVKAKE